MIKFDLEILMALLSEAGRPIFFLLFIILINESKGSSNKFIANLVRSVLPSFTIIIS